MTVLTPLNLQNKGYTAKSDRSLIADIFDRQERVIAASDLVVTAAGGLATSIAGGRCLVQGDTNPDQGMYHCFNDAPLTRAHTPDVTNPRINRLVMKVDDADEVGFGSDDADVIVVPGTPVAAANLNNPAHWPAVPLSAMPIARVRVSSTRSITSGDIVDERPFPLGFLASRPPAGIPGRDWLSADTGVVSYDYGTGWLDINPRDYRTIHQAVVVLQLDLPAGVYYAAAGDAFAVKYIDADDFTAQGRTPKLRVRATALVNGTAPATNYVCGLSGPVVVSGGADSISFGGGSSVAGSTATINAPAANGAATATGADFDVPADGTYTLYVATTATLANNNLTVVKLELQQRW